MVYILIKMKIKDTFLDKDFTQCSLLLTNFLKTVLKDKTLEEMQRNELIWYYYFYKSNIFLRQFQYDKAKNFCLESFKYIKYKDKYNSNYKLTLYLLAKIYEKLKINSIALKIYKFALKQLLTEDDKCFLVCLYNIQKLKDDVCMFNTKSQYQQKYKTNIETDINFAYYF